MRPDNRSDWAATTHIASKLGVTPETLRVWLQRADGDQGLSPGVSSTAQAEIKRLKKQIRELEQTNVILRSASVFSQRSSAAPRRNDPVH